MAANSLRPERAIHLSSSQFGMNEQCNYHQRAIHKGESLVYVGNGERVNARRRRREPARSANAEAAQRTTRGNRSRERQHERIGMEKGKRIGWARCELDPPSGKRGKAEHSTTGPFSRRSAHLVARLTVGWVALSSRDGTTGTGGGSSDGAVGVSLKDRTKRLDLLLKVGHGRL